MLERKNTMMRRLPPTRKPVTFRPQLDALEGRCVPSTLMVTSIADSGPGSLRATIATAQRGDTIQFASSPNMQTITLTSGQLVINTNVIIAGPGTNLLALSGGSQSNIFKVNSTSKLTISGLLIEYGHGTTEPGGAFYNLGTLVISNSILFQCTSTNGGAIYNAGTLTVSDSSLVGDSASDGGAIYNVGTMTISNCVVDNNTASTDGGAIYNASGASATLKGVNLYDNSAVNVGGGIYNANNASLALESNTTVQLNYIDGFVNEGDIYNLGSLRIKNSYGGLIGP
jgi:predicted outer membrane repeat protein